MADGSKERKDKGKQVIICKCLVPKTDVLILYREFPPDVLDIYDLVLKDWVELQENHNNGESLTKEKRVSELRS